MSDCFVIFVFCFRKARTYHVVQVIRVFGQAKTPKFWDLLAYIGLLGPAEASHSAVRRVPQLGVARPGDYSTHFHTGLHGGI